MNYIEMFSFNVLQKFHSNFSFWYFNRLDYYALEQQILNKSMDLFKKVSNFLKYFNLDGPYRRSGHQKLGHPLSSRFWD